MTQIFDGEVAVFSHAIPEIYLQDYEALGGCVANTREEMDNAVFFFADGEWDIQFIAMFWNSSRAFRVLDKRYIFECAFTKRRPPEAMFAYAVTTSGRIILAATRHKWRGFVEKTITGKRKREKGGEEQCESEDTRNRASGKHFLGLLTPAPSLIPRQNQAV